MNGFIKLNLGGEERPFKFGLYVIGEVLHELDIDVAEIEVVLKKNPLRAISSFAFHAAAYAAAKEHKIVDFDRMAVCEWIDDAGGTSGDFMLAFTTALYQSMSKDVPPLEGGDAKKPVASIGSAK